MKTWDALHRGILLGMGGLTLIATYRSVEEYKKRAAIQERREAAKAAAWAKKAAVEAEAEAAARAAAPATLAKAK